MIESFILVNNGQKMMLTGLLAIGGIESVFSAPASGTPPAENTTGSPTDGLPTNTQWIKITGLLAGLIALVLAFVLFRSRCCGLLKKKRELTEVELAKMAKRKEQLGLQQQAALHQEEGIDNKGLTIDTSSSPGDVYTIPIEMKAKSAKIIRNSQSSSARTTPAVSPTSAPPINNPNEEVDHPIHINLHDNLSSTSPAEPSNGGGIHLARSNTPKPGPSSPPPSYTEEEDNKSREDAINNVMEEEQQLRVADNQTTDGGRRVVIDNNIQTDDGIITTNPRTIHQQNDKHSNRVGQEQQQQTTRRPRRTPPPPYAEQEDDPRMETIEL